jgi:hypothetical protein
MEGFIGERGLGGWAIAEEVEVVADAGVDECDVNDAGSWRSEQAMPWSSLMRRLHFDRNSRRASSAAEQDVHSQPQTTCATLFGLVVKVGITKSTCSTSHGSGAPISNP